MSPVKRPILALAVCIASACGTAPAPSTNAEPPVAPTPTIQKPAAEAKLEVRTEKYPNGKLQSEGKVELREGEEISVGLWTYWYEDGTKAGEVNFKEGKEDGPLRMWHPNGKVRMSGAMRKGEPIGALTFWYENGSKQRVQSYQDGLLRGAIESWYESGQLASRHSISEGKPEGVDEGWYPNGKEMFRKSFVNGLTEGKAVAWYESGSKRWEINYSKGRLHGSYTRWYRNGQLWFEGSYARGYADGSWKAHHHNRARLLEATYASRKIVSERCWSKSGKKRTCRDDETSELRGDYESDSDQPPGEPTQFDEIYLMHLSEQKDLMCRCDEDDCVQKVSGYMDKFVFEFQGIRPTSTMEVQLKGIGREISACRDSLGSEYRGMYKK